MASASGRRELRFKPQCMKPLSLRAQFENMPLGDCWEEARLWEPMEYLFKSKKLRWGHFMSPKVTRPCNFRVGLNKKQVTTFPLRGHSLGGTTKRKITMDHHVHNRGTTL